MDTGTMVAPNDRNGLYVWKGTTGLHYGTLDAFEARQQSVSCIPSADWTVAIETAREIANQDGIPTIYVVRS
jgi:hypothetical protein